MWSALLQPSSTDEKNEAQKGQNLVHNHQVSKWQNQPTNRGLLFPEPVHLAAMLYFCNFRLQSIPIYWLLCTSQSPTKVEWREEKRVKPQTSAFPLTVLLETSRFALKGYLGRSAAAAVWMKPMKSGLVLRPDASRMCLTLRNVRGQFYSMWEIKFIPWGHSQIKNLINLLINFSCSYFGPTWEISEKIAQLFLKCMQLGNLLDPVYSS